MRLPRPLTLRSRILLFQVLVAAGVVSMFVAGLVAIRGFERHLERQALAHAQLDLIVQLGRDTRQYGAKAAEMLMTGASLQLELARLDRRLQQGFDALAAATEAERVFLARHGEASDAEAERERVERMRRLFADMNGRVGALYMMQRAGQGEAALQVFFRDIGNGLGDAVELVLADAVADEMQEVETADALANRAARALGLLLGATALLVLLATLVAGYFFYRSIVRPLARLETAAVAVGGGDLAHRVGRIGADELGLLAGRFDAMAAQLQEQQAQLLAAQSDLESQVRARTRELEHAVRRLTELDRSRLRFLADISHELRTPLTVLRGEAEVTLRSATADPAASRDALQRIAEQAREMAGLVDDLMLVARAETEDVGFDLGPLDLAPLVAEAAHEAGMLGRGRGVAVAAELAAVAPVRGDARRMKQILMILLDNAVKYSRRGAGVDIRLASADGTVRLSVCNRSEHLDEIDLPRLFERFYRGPEAAQGGSGGSGLGLAIARSMIERQGGSIALARDGEDRLRVDVEFPAAPPVAAPERAVAAQLL